MTLAHGKSLGHTLPMTISQPWTTKPSCIRTLCTFRSTRKPRLISRRWSLKRPDVLSLSTRDVFVSAQDAFCVLLTLCPYRPCWQRIRCSEYDEIHALILLSPPLTTPETVRSEGAHFANQPGLMFELSGRPSSSQAMLIFIWSITSISVYRYLARCEVLGIG